MAWSNWAASAVPDQTESAGGVVVASVQSAIATSAAAINGCDCPVRTDRTKEPSMGYFLDARIDRCGPFLGPVWPPSPAHHVGVQQMALQVVQGDLGCRCYVVSLDGQITDRVHQGIRHVQPCHKVMPPPPPGTEQVSRT